ATAIPDTFEILPKTPFDFVVNGAGFGSRRFNRTFQPGATVDLRLDLPRNAASTASGAVVSGDGVNLDKIADETEATDWASLDGVAGKKVTIDLAGDHVQLVTTVNVSAMLRPAIVGDADAGPQNRFTALRSFKIQACLDLLFDCTQDSSYFTIAISKDDAFP